MARRERGDGALYQRGDGRWVGAVVLGHGERKAVYGKTRAEAKQKLAAAQRSHPQGEALIRSRETTEHYLRTWLAGREGTIKRNTWIRHRQAIEAHILPAIGHVPLASLNSADIQALISGMTTNGKSPQTIKNTIGPLHSALVRAVDSGLISRDPSASRLLDKPRVRREEMRIFSTDQAKLLITNTIDEPIWALTLHTGMRLGEVLALRWASVDLDAGSLLVVENVQTIEGRQLVDDVKTPRGRRRIALNGLVVDALRRQKASNAKAQLAAGPNWVDRDLLFPNKTGDYLKGAAVLKALRRREKAVGLPNLKFHELRHTAASLLLSANVPVMVVSRILGHAGIQITLDTYGHLLENQERLGADALEALLG